MDLRASILAVMGGCNEVEPWFNGGKVFNQDGFG